MREDARISAPPLPLWYEGRDAIVSATQRLAAADRFRYLAAGSNMQLAAASYVRSDGDSVYRPMGIDVLTIESGLVAEITVFLRPDLFKTFGLPAAL